MEDHVLRIMLNAKYPWSEATLKEAAKLDFIERFIKSEVRNAGELAMELKEKDAGPRDNECQKIRQAHRKARQSAIW